MPTPKELEIEEVRNVAETFRAMILDKQVTYNDYEIDYIPEDLVKGTPYEAGTVIDNDKISYTATYGTYEWVYTPRCGDAPAILTEISGFN